VVGRGRDVVVAAAFAVLALIFVVEGASLPLVARGVPGPGLFPLLLAVAILAVAAVLAVQAVLGRGSTRTTTPDGDAEGDTEGDDDGGSDAESDGRAESAEPPSVRRPLLLWGVVLLASIALPVIGFLPAMLLLSLILLLGLERRFDVTTVASAVAVPVACYVLFGVVLDVRLPVGLFG
jgi:putative tricarboxylic transport membrane protein